MKEAPKPKNKKPGNGFKFNPYWIYGILFIVFLALNFLPRSAGKSTHWNEVRNMIVQGDVKELKLINDRFLEVYITTEASEKEEYAKTRRKQDMFGQIEPNYSFEIEKNYFNEEVKELKKKLDDPNSLVIKYESHSDIFGQLFQWVFAFVRDPGLEPRTENVHSQSLHRSIAHIDYWSLSPKSVLEQKKILLKILSAKFCMKFRRVRL